MRLLSEIRERLRALVFSRQEEKETAEELRFHLDMEAEKNIRGGMAPDEARRRARLAFGGVDRFTEEVRDARGIRPLENFARDLRYAFRTLGRTPAFTTVAVATLAVGIGASTAMFTLVNSVLLRPLAYAVPDRLVAVWERNPRGLNNLISPANLLEWREQGTSFHALAAWADRPFNLGGEGEPEEVLVRLATANYFAVLGAAAHLGRPLLPGDDRESVAVLSHRLWQRRYGGDPSAVGRIITINDNPFTVVGVMPPEFPSVGGQPEIWRPIALSPEGRGRFLRAVGRLKPAATLEGARGEMEAIAARLSAEGPAYNLNWGVNVVPLQDEVTGQARPALLLLLGAVALLLLIACANVANLFLGRAAARRKEMAIRRSLGATRARLVAQILTEAAVVAAVAGALGLALASAAIDAIVRARPADVTLSRLGEVAIDYRVLVFAIAVSLLTALLFGAAPALATSGVNPGGALRDSTRGATGGPTRLPGALVVAEVALALVLLAGAGLLVRTVHNLMQVDPGLRAEGVLTMRMMLSQQRYPDEPALRDFVEALLPRLEALPGAVSAGAIGWLPLTGLKSNTAFRREDMPPPSEGEEPGADIRVVAGDYFAALGIPLLRGRTFDRRDTEDAPVRFVINEALARQYFPGEDPVGKRLAYWWGDMVSGEIIGVVGSVREMTLDAEPSPAIYRAYPQEPWPMLNVVLSTQGDPVALGPAAAAAVREIAPHQPVAAIRAFEDVVADTLARQRLSMILLAGFAAVSLLLVVIGIYGVIAYSVTQRKREIGVRIALGAQRRDVLLLVVGHGLILTVAGLAVGLAGALALGRFIEGLLFGVAPADPGTIAIVSLVLAATAAVASYLPASRATRIDPVGVLAADG